MVPQLPAQADDRVREISTYSFPPVCYMLTGNQLGNHREKEYGCAGERKLEGSTPPSWDSVSWHINLLIQAPCTATMHHFLLILSENSLKDRMSFSPSPGLFSFCHRGLPVSFPWGANYQVSSCIRRPIRLCFRVLLCPCFSTCMCLKKTLGRFQGLEKGWSQCWQTEAQAEVHIQSQRFCNDKSQKPCQGTGQCPRDGHGIIKKEVSVGQSNYFHSWIPTLRRGI